MPRTAIDVCNEIIAENSGNVAFGGKSTIESCLVDAATQVLESLAPQHQITLIDMAKPPEITSKDEEKLRRAITLKAEERFAKQNPEESNFNAPKA